MNTMVEITEVGEFGVTIFVGPMPLPVDISAIATAHTHTILQGRLWSLACILTPSITSVKKPWRRVPSAMYNTMVDRAGDLRDIYHETEVQKSQEERRAAMERLDIIKNAKGLMLRSQLVAEVCAALLAAGSTKG